MRCQEGTEILNATWAGPRRIAARRRGPAGCAMVAPATRPPTTSRWCNAARRGGPILGPVGQLGKSMGVTANLLRSGVSRRRLAASVRHSVSRPSLERTRRDDVYHFTRWSWISLVVRQCRWHSRQRLPEDRLQQHHRRRSRHPGDGIAPLKEVFASLRKSAMWGRLAPTFQLLIMEQDPTAGREDRTRKTRPRRRSDVAILVDVIQIRPVRQPVRRTGRDRSRAVRTRSCRAPSTGLSECGRSTAGRGRCAVHRRHGPVRLESARDQVVQPRETRGA